MGGKRPTYPSGEDNSYPILPYPYAMDWGKQKRSFSEVGCCVQIEGNRGFEFWEYFFEESRSSREMAVEMVTSLSLEGYCTSLSGVFLIYSDFPSKFVWNSQVPFKVKSFVWLFQLAKMDWVPPRSISDMMSIKFKGFGTSKRGIVLWQVANIALIRVVWWERNARIFEDKQGIQSFFGTLLFSLLLFGLSVLKHLRGLPLM
ncbi:hypothetical protein CK203_000550 [Vitis vinifera]|uniref:Reverse transcriptase zinc-binding domain-containing protein n=1 Tax=Vitis vinifera TaxID=29760 RepID=A0A438KS08_VITVI|nr:hypothetical protein CK203_000550 [Vitis vinifera]